MFKLEDVHAGYAGVIVRDVNISVNPGEVHALLGPNGSGKSTLLRSAAGVIPPFKGRILLDGIDIFRNPHIKRRIGYMPEGEAIFRGFTVERLIKVMCRLYEAKINERVFEETRIKEIMNKTIGSLSMGQKRRVLLSLALVHDPDVLILDEPTANLDFTTADEMRRLIKQLAKEGRAIFMASHNIPEVQELASHVEVIFRGSIVFQDLISNVEKHIKSMVSVRIRCTGDPSACLRELGYGVIQEGDSYIIAVRNFDEEMPKITAYLGSKGLNIKEVAKAGNPLGELLREKLEEGS
ncbi:MAG: ABC transporter ATP-binding protein [Candidatus Methanodesulfokora sp.]